MKEIKIFSHEMFGDVRTMTNENGETYFVGKDVAEVLESRSCLTTTQIAKELDMTVHDLTRLLMERKVMYKQSGQYMLYADFARKGYAKNRTHSHYDSEGELHTRTYLVWTERGRRMIHRMCKTEEVMIPFVMSVEFKEKED